MHMTAAFVDRVCNKVDGYSLEPYSSFKIPQGMTIMLPLHGLARDEEYLDDPWIFNPDRFEANIPTHAALPFGIGPRSCPGERFAMIILKAALVNVLKNFRIEMNEKTPKVLKINKRASILRYEDTLTVDFVRDLI